MKRNTHYESIFCGESNNINHTFSVNMIFFICWWSKRQKFDRNES